MVPNLYFAEEGSALLGHLRCVLVELQWLGELIHQHVGLIWVALCEILHLALQEHQAAMPCIQLIPHVLENEQCKVSSDNAVLDRHHLFENSSRSGLFGLVVFDFVMCLVAMIH